MTIGSSKMTSVRPYLVKAYYEWINDNQLTPFLQINAKCAYVEVPLQFVERGQIILNIAPLAVEALRFDTYALSFRARFGSTIEDIYVPIPAILGLYAKENSQGLFFDEEDEAPPRPRELPTTLNVEGKKRPQGSHLKIVKSDVIKPSDKKGDE